MRVAQIDLIEYLRNAGYQVSEKAVEFLLQNARSSSGGLDITTLKQSILPLAVLTLPVRSAAQDAAVGSIATLAIHHKTLEDPDSAHSGSN